MRVGLISPYSLSMPGGVQAQVLGLARALRSMGVEARVLGPCDGPPADTFVTPLGNSIPNAGNGSIAALAPDPAAALRTMRALRDEAFDVVHLHEPIVPGPTLVALMFHDGPMLGTYHRAGTSGWYRLTGLFRHFTTDRLQLRVAVSAQAAATGRRASGGDHYEILWNGIDVDAFRSATPWPTLGPTVMFIGRHEPRKGLRTLLDARPSLPTGTRLWIAGTGPQTDELRALTRDDPCVEWLGAIDDEEKRQRLRGADVLCVPSVESESFGVVLLEGMAAGTAVVASDLDGYRNVVRRADEGLLVEPGSSAALAAAISRVLAGGPAIDAMVACASLRADELSMERLARRYIELYERLAPAATWR